MASVLTMFMIRRRSFRQKVASVSIACSWTRSMRCPAFHRPKAMLTSRCAWVFSCDMIFTPKFFGLPDTPVAHFFFALPMAAEQPTALPWSWFRHAYRRYNINRIAIAISWIVLGRFVSVRCSASITCLHVSSRSLKAMERRDVATSECLEDRHIIFNAQI